MDRLCCRTIFDQSRIFKSREEIQDQERNEVNKGRLNNREVIELPLPSLFKL